jgi:outer membrane protein TolC
MRSVLGGCAANVLGGCAARVLDGCAFMVLTAAVAGAQPVPTERVTFDEAIRRAIENNPSSAIAAAGILRADALLTEARSATRLQLNGNVTTITLNRGVEFDGATVTPRNQLNGSLDVRYPLYAPVRWAQRTQAEDNKAVAEANEEDVRRQTAFATADAYLTIIARRRLVVTNETARDTSRAHFELARQLEQAGSGSRLNMLRAQQEYSLNETQVEGARLLLYRAQEALGVLLVADGPVDAMDEPTFATPEEAAAIASAATTAQPTDLANWRPDLLVEGQVSVSGGGVSADHDLSVAVLAAAEQLAFPAAAVGADLRQRSANGIEDGAAGRARYLARDVRQRTDHGVL